MPELVDLICQTCPKCKRTLLPMCFGKFRGITFATYQCLKDDFQVLVVLEVEHKVE